MLVSDISKEPDLAFRHEHGHAQSMNWRITESFIVEPASTIKPLEVFLVRFAPEEPQITNLEVREELAIIVVTPVEWIKQPVQICLRMYQLRMRVDETHRPAPQTRETARIIQNIHRETIFDVVVAHEAEDIVVDVAEVVDVWLDAPVEVEFEESWMAIEKARVPATHVTVGYHPAFADTDCTKVFERVHESTFVDPFG